MSIKEEVKKTKRQKMITLVLNHQVQGEAFILTEGITWKAIVLNHYNKIKRGEMSIDELVDRLESKYGVKYAQKRSLVKYPIEEFIQYITKVSNNPP